MASMNDILSLERLPALPAAVARAIVLLTDPDGESTDLERVIAQDEALTAAVLRLANSVRYGAPGRRFELTQSISRLGRRALGRCVLEQQVARVVAPSNAAFGLERGALWRSALGGAIAAEALARRHAPDEASLVFVGALLRDIGKLAIDAYFGGGYLALVSDHDRPGRSFIEAEHEALGFDHAQVGGALARKWNLPERVAGAIETHHAPPPPGPGHDVVSDMVHAGDVICRWAGLGIGIDGMDYRLAEHVRQGMKLDRRSAERDIALAWDALREAEGALSDTGKQGAAA